MSRTRPLPPKDQRGFLSLAEISFTETLLTHVCNALYAKYPYYKRDLAASPKGLATLVLQLQVVMDELLGEKVPEQNRFEVKIPSVFFRDFAHPNGTLKHIIAWSLEFRKNYQTSVSGQSSRRFELNLSKNKQFSIDLIKFLWKKLRKENIWNPPKVFLANGFSNDEKKMYQDIVSNLSGIVVENRQEATHIVFPDKVIDTKDTEHYYRVLEKRGFKMLVHWWYFPDSYDTWIVYGGGGYQTGVTRKVSFNESSLLLLPKNGIWTLSCEWLSQSKRFNEWMNEGDFELSQDNTSDSPYEKNVSTTGTIVQHKKPNFLSSQTIKQGKRDSNVLDAYVDEDDTDLLDKDDEDEEEDDEMYSGFEKRISRHKMRGSKRDQTFRRLVRQGKERKLRSRSSSTYTLTRSKRAKKNASQTQQSSMPIHDSCVVSFICSKPIRSKNLPFYKKFSECYITFSTIPLDMNIKDDHSLLTLDENIDDPCQSHAKRILSSEIMNETLSLNLSDESEGGPLNSGVLTGPITQQSASSCQKKKKTLSMENSFKSTSFSNASNAPFSISPGVIQHPRRSLSKSISNANHEQVFQRLRLINPLDKELDSRILSLKHASSLKGQNHQNATENALRTMVALWASSCDYPYVFGLNENAEKENPDVPPFYVEKGDVIQNSMINGTLDKLSMGEHDVLKDEYTKNISDQVDLFKECGVTREKASQIPVKLPSVTEKWFDLNRVHTLEKEHINVWFHSLTMMSQLSSTSNNLCNSTFENQEEKDTLLNEYMTLRNAIILRYRVNPLRYLTMSQCRLFLDHDVGLIVRVHTFLDFWGIINFQSLPHTRPSRNFRTLNFIPSSQPLDKKKKEEMSLKIANNNDISIPIVKCIVCKHTCLNSYYILNPSLRTGVSRDVLRKACWCLKCIANGQFPEVLTQRQFLKVTLPATVNRMGKDTMIEWSNEELEKLLDAIEIHGENWEAIEAHVVTRSAFECVSCFLRLPLDESTSPTPKEEDTSFTTVFNNATNPLMTQLKFLSAVVGEQIGEEAAKSAYDSLLGKYAEDLSTMQNKEDIKTLLVKQLEKKLEPEDVKNAISKALKTAALAAITNAEKEDRKICELLACLNELKEKQVEKKINFFYSQESLIRERTEELEQKLHDCLTTRDDLKSALMNAQSQHDNFFQELHSNEFKTIIPNDLPLPTPLQQFRV